VTFAANTIFSMCDQSLFRAADSKGESRASLSWLTKRHLECVQALLP